MKWIQSFQQKWLNRGQVGDSQISRLELAFLPAALEIKEKPPHPASRVTAWVLLALFTIGIIWACVSEVDIVATAEGKIIPSGQVKQIQPYGRAVVSAILVREGQLVKAGQSLIELDRGQTGANQKQIEQEIQQNRLNHYRLTHVKKFLDQIDQPSGKERSSAAENSNVSGITQTNWSISLDYKLQQQKQQNLLLEQQKENIKSELMRLHQQLVDREAELQVNNALINKLKGTLPLVTQRVNALKKLMQQKMAAKVQFLELEQLRVEQLQDLIGAKATGRRLLAQIDGLKQQRSSFVAQTRSENLQEILQTDREYLSFKEELNKAKDLNKKQILTSPVSGLVQDLAVHTVGGVVTEAQSLMKIVPENQRLEVEAWLENKDIGFVYAEQLAEVKVHTFPFTKYGIINGKIETVSTDATSDEKRGLIYKAKVILEKNNLMVDGRKVQLVSGMGVSAEIKIGKRFLIEYLTAPLQRYKSESIRER